MKPQRINLQIIKTALAAKKQNKTKNPKNPIKKMGRPKYTFLQRRNTDGQQTHEKMSSITNYKRNANQNCNEVSLHTSQNGQHQKNL